MAIIQLEEDTPYLTARAPDTMHSGGAGPCLIAGAIYRNRGFLLHTISTGEDTDFYDFFKDLSAIPRGDPRLSIYLTGCGLEDGINEEIPIDYMTLETRALVVQRIVNLGHRQNIRAVNWSTKDTVQELVLNLRSRRAYLEILNLRKNACSSMPLQ